MTNERQVGSKSVLKFKIFLFCFLASCVSVANSIV